MAFFLQKDPEMRTSVGIGTRRFLRIVLHLFVVSGIKDIIMSISTLRTVLAVVCEVEECTWRRFL